MILLDAVYVNGAQVVAANGHEAEWWFVGTYSSPSATVTSVAIKCSKAGYFGAMLASNADGLIKTDGSWRCTSGSAIDLANWLVEIQTYLSG